MAMQHKYLESIGWVTEDFIVKQAGCNKKQAQEIHDEIQKILEEERSA